MDVHVIDKSQKPTPPVNQKPWRGIIKLQKAIVGEPSVLIYNRARSIMVQWTPQDLPPEQWANLVSWFDGEPIPKIYMRAQVRPDGTLHIMNRANNQDW